MHPSRRSLAGKLLPAALVLLQLLAWAAPSQAHGYMSNPASRNLNKWRGEVWRATMGNGIGPRADVSRNGNPSVCGDPYQDQFYVTNVVGERGSAVATYTQGQTISITLTLTVNHGGRHQFAVCPQGTSGGQGCFDNVAYALRRSSNNARYLWRGRTGYNPGGNPVWTPDTFTESWRLPSNVNCANGCVLQWRWITSNTCAMACDFANGDDTNFCGPRGPAICAWNAPWNTPEIFNNCADIIITGSGSGGGEVAPQPSPSPAPRPAPTSTSGGTCAKCNVSLCRGGCKCDSSCACRAGLGGAPCDKCNMPQSEGGCKCDSNCNCLPGSCWF